MKKIRNNFLAKVGYFIMAIWFFPLTTFAQGLTRSVEQSSGTTLDAFTYQGYALVGLRFLLGVLLLIAGMVGFKAGFNWLYWEGNAKKAKEAKTTLAKALLFVTIMFIISALFRWWLGGDYVSLVV